MRRFYKQGGGDRGQGQVQLAFWESPDTVALYQTATWLLRGERLALASCFSDGLTGRRVLELGCGAGRVTRLL